MNGLITHMGVGGPWLLIRTWSRCTRCTINMWFGLCRETCPACDFILRIVVCAFLLRALHLWVQGHSLVPQSRCIFLLLLRRRWWMWECSRLEMERPGVHLETDRARWVLGDVEIAHCGRQTAQEWLCSMRVGGKGIFGDLEKRGRKLWYGSACIVASSLSWIGEVWPVVLSRSVWWWVTVSDIDEMALNALSWSDCRYHGVLVVQVRVSNCGCHWSDRNKQLECSDYSTKHANEMFAMFYTNATLAHLRVPVKGTCWAVLDVWDWLRVHHSCLFRLWKLLWVSAMNGRWCAT